MGAPNVEGGFTGPYRGLEPFDESAAAFFFGRERETRLIEASLFAAPLTLLYGASGVGKSSVLRAGVLPRLRERSDLLPVVFPSFASDAAGGLRLERGWQINPVGGIKATIAEALYRAAAENEQILRQYRDAVLKHEMLPLRDFCDAISATTERRIMMILDQFEDYSLYHPDEEAFAVQFAQTVAPGNRSVSFLLSLREDALAKLDRFKGDIAILWDSYRRIDHLTRRAAEDAIRLPLQEYNRRRPESEPAIQIENPLIDKVLRDVQTGNVQFEETGSGTLRVEGDGPERIETPYLQLVMTRLWEREQAKKSTCLRLATLNEEGGAAEIVRTHLDRVMKQFTPEEQDLAAKIFHRLVTPSGTKIAFSVTDLAEYEAVEPDQLAPILRRLEEGSRRILRRVATRSDAVDDPRYEIFHDRLGKAILSWRNKRLKELAQERQQRELAEVQKLAEETREVASHGNVSLARYSEESGKNALALAHLAQALRLNPDNREAVAFTAAMLTQLSWRVRLADPMWHDAWVHSAQFSPDGQRVVTASSDNTARLWDAASGKPIGKPMNHGDIVTSARFSPDGQRVVTASTDNTARLWDAASGKPIGEPMRHLGVVTSARFSADGQRVVTASNDTTARLWDAVSGKPIGKPMNHESVVTSAQFSPDGQRVATASEDRTARVWDSVSGKPIGKPMNHESVVASAQFSPDGQRVVTASWDKTARVWDAASGQSIGEPMEHKGSVYSAQFSPDGQRVVTASADNTARLWDSVSGKPIGAPMEHEEGITSAWFSPDGQRVVTTSEDKTARLWDAVSGKPVDEPMKHEGLVTSARFSPDGQRVVTASGDNTAQLWGAVSGKPIGEPMKHEGSVYSAQFSRDGQRVVTASSDNTARLWDAASGKPVGKFMNHGDIVTSARFSPDGQRVVTASADNTARLWDAASGKPIGEPMRHLGVVTSARFSADGQRVVTTSNDTTARLWDAVSGKPIGKFMNHGDIVTSAQFSPDGQRVATASEDRTARVWDSVSGKPIGKPMNHESVVASAQFSPDGQRVVTASWDKTARVWDAASGQSIGEPMEHKGSVYSAQFSPDGQRVVTASADNTARLWDSVSGKPIGAPMEHEEGITSAWFSPDGQRVVTTSEDKTARLWDAVSGKPVGKPMKHEGSVYSAQFSPDGQRVVTASYDKTAQLWDAAIMTDKDTREDILLLAELAVATGGLTLETVGQAENLKLLTLGQVIALREKIAAKFPGPSQKLTPLQRVMKWSVLDRRNRTISPFFKTTASEWLENRIKEGTVEALREAMQVDPTDARVTAYLGRRLADFALEQGSDPDEAQRARGEADFLTRRALKLAPDNDEVKKLRDKVVKLLELKTN